MANNYNVGLFVKDLLLKVNLFNYAKKWLMYLYLIKRSNLKNNENILKTITKAYKVHVPSLDMNKGNQIKNLFSKIEINIPSEGFIFTIDTLKTTNNLKRIMENMSVDYSKILNTSLDELILKYSNDDEYSINQKAAIEGILILIDREIDALKLSSRQDKAKYIKFLENIKHSEVSSFEEALQRILFFNQLLWQTNHKLNGFGRLDLILDDIYSKDSISKDKALILIKDFLKACHSYYSYKSNELIGDTGQIIVIGGLDINGEYFYNDLSYLFIQAISELNIPDPKIILRYSKDIPKSLMTLSLKCMATGVGSPLISNDDVIIEKLIDFGYDGEYAYNYVVSACWEPAPIGNSLELNNLECLVFLEPLNLLFDNENLDEFNDFNSLFAKYKEYLAKYTEQLLAKINTYEWEIDPLISLFINGCDDNLKDASNGAALYNNYGLTAVALSNTVNSLLNIKALVFDENKFTLDELNNHRQNNFEDENILDELKSQPLKFGNDEAYVIQITNDIINCAEEVFKLNSTKNGGKFKFGLSAPSYISRSIGFDASFDGRKNSNPFNVHISFEDNEDYVELMRFASKLDYSGSKFNGNVVDFMVTPQFINTNFDKFLDFLIISLDMGVFQMQLNVIDSKTLIDAKKNPDKYPNLIVRVWGFSAYFKDLPEDYQNNLIKRAIEHEAKVN